MEQRAHLTVLQEELQQAYETHAHSQRLYEAEVRRARKEAFKASSALVKLQEELKSARNKYTLMREEVEVQKRKVEDQEQEIFMAQYKAVGLQEEVEAQKLKVEDQEQDIFMAERRANGLLEEIDGLTEQLKASYDVREVYKETLKVEAAIREDTDQRMSLSRAREEEGLDRLRRKIEIIREEKEAVEINLKVEKGARMTAEETIDFMQMECQFQCCPCRIAEKHHRQYIHDEGPATQSAKNPATIKPAVDPSKSTNPPKYHPPTCSSPILEPDGETAENRIEFSPKTGTFYTLSEPMTSPEEMSPVRLNRLPSR